MAFELFKKRVNFFELLINQCEAMQRGMQALYDYCTTKDESYADLVIKIEDEGDMLRRIVIDELNNTLITPIERNDIFNLSRQIDEILDYAKTTVDELRKFKITPNDDIVVMVGILLDISVRISKAISNTEKHKNIAKDDAIAVKALENKMAAHCVDSLARLFETDDWRLVFKYREIYRHLNTTSDVADVAMDSLLDVINKI
jgi:uncharacterized protein